MNREAVANELVRIAEDLIAMAPREECPGCGKEYNTSEMEHDEKKHTLNCPDCGCVIIERYRGKE